MMSNSLPQFIDSPVVEDELLRRISGVENGCVDELESDEPPLESDLHRELIELLLACLREWWQDRDDFYATGNLTIYYNPNRLTTQDFRGPDFFVVLGAKRRPRKSWMVWREDYRYPNVIVELLSDSTARVDRTTKKDLYQNTFKTPEYFWFHPDTQEFAGFRLVEGVYQPIRPNPGGWLWSEQLQLYFGIWDDRLRLFSPEGKLLPTPKELAQAANQVAAQERQRAEQERQRAEQVSLQLTETMERSQRMAEVLRSLGIDPDNLPDL